MESAKYHVMAADANGNWADLVSNMADAGTAFEVFNDIAKANPHTRLRLVATTVMQEYRGDLKSKESEHG